MKTLTIIAAALALAPAALAAPSPSASSTATGPAQGSSGTTVALQATCPAPDDGHLVGCRGNRKRLRAAAGSRKETGA